MLRHNQIKESKNKIFICILLFIVTLLFMINSPLHFGRNEISKTDSSVFRTIAMMMDEGYMPYKDTFDHKGPLIYIINWLARKINNQNGIFWFEFIGLFTTFTMMYKMAYLKCSRAISFLIMLMAMIPLFKYYDGGNYTEEFALPFIAISLFCFLDYFWNANYSVKRLIVCGFSFAAVCLLRINMVSVWGVFCIAIVIHSICKKRFNDLKNFIIYFCVGIVILVVPIVCWLYYNGALYDCWMQYIEFNILYSKYNSGSVLNSLLGTLKFCTEPITLIAIGINLGLIFGNLRKRECIYVIYFVYIISTIVLINMSGKGFNHYGMILVPALCFPYAALYERYVGKKKILWTLQLLFVCIFMIAGGSWWKSTLQNNIFTLINGGETNKNSVVDEICSIIGEQSSKEDKISVYGNWDIIYLESGRLPATKYSYQFNIYLVEPNIMNEYFEQLEEEQPSFIVLQKNRYDERIENFIENNDYSLVWNEDVNLYEGASLFIKNKSE